MAVMSHIRLLLLAIQWFRINMALLVIFMLLIRADCVCGEKGEKLINILYWALCNEKYTYYIDTFTKRHIGGRNIM